jgi:hypothetical protein
VATLRHGNKLSGIVLAVVVFVNKLARSVLVCKSVTTGEAG